MTGTLYLISFLCGFVTICVLFFFRSYFYNCAESSVSLLDGVLSKKSDVEKVVLLQQKTAKLLKHLLLVLIVLLVLIFVYLTPLFSFDKISSTHHLMLFSLGGILAYLLLPKSKSSYSELAMLLHRLVLNNYNIQKLLFRREKRKNKITNREDFLIVSGLARSGTTALTKHLSETDFFSSLSYANMPFLLAPRTWLKYYKPKNKQQKERAHKDRISVGLDSVEAFDEYFFKVFLEDNFIGKKHLKNHEADDLSYNEYLNYQSLIRVEDEKIYLSKNNNFLLRYDSLRQKNNRFKMAVMFREPLSHAYSLLNQHKLFFSLQKEDSFILEYMNWLGHHEFGLNQKPFYFEETSQFLENNFSLDYWLQVWINYYSYAIKVDKQGLLLIDYDDLCAQPTKVISCVLKEFNVSLDKEIQGYKNEKTVNESFSPELLEKANSIYSKLKEVKTAITQP